MLITVSTSEKADVIKIYVKKNKWNKNFASGIILCYYLTGQIRLQVKIS